MEKRGERGATEYVLLQNVIDENYCRRRFKVHERDCTAILSFGFRATPWRSRRIISANVFRQTSANEGVSKEGTAELIVGHYRIGISPSFHGAVAVRSDL